MFHFDFFLRPLIAHNVDSLVQKVNKNLPFGWLESINIFPFPEASWVMRH